MAKYITDILKEINEDPSSVSKYKDNTAIKLIFEWAYNPEKKFLLPEGDPPYTEDPAPIGMSPANLYQEIRRFYIFQRADLTAYRRESIFVTLLESLHPSEAKLMLAIKDQNLSKLYKNLTHKFLYENGMVSVEPTKVTKGKKQKSEDGAESSLE